MNFPRQDFRKLRKLSYYRQTYKETDTTEIIYHAALRVVSVHVARQLMHGVFTVWSASRQQRYYHLNDIIWTASIPLKQAQIHALKEPMGLMRQDSKRPDGSAILP